jgi:molybdopterin converting factor small subunit
MGQVVRVAIPTPLRSYCNGAATVTIACPDEPPTLGDLLASLDSAYPGMRFRMQDEQGKLRPHIQVFINGVAHRELNSMLPSEADIMIVAALSGG